MRQQEFLSTMEGLSSQINRLENRDEIFLSLAQLNNKFVHIIASSGAGPLPSPSRTPDTTTVQIISCPICNNTMTVK